VTEPLVLAALALAGGAVALGSGCRSVIGILSLSLPFGVFSYILAGAVLLATGLPAYPAIALACVLILGGLTGARGVRRAGPGCLLAPVGAAAAVFAASSALVDLEFVTFTADSFSYLASAGVLAEHGNFADVRSQFVLKRGLTVPYLHAIASIGGRDLLFSVNPLLAVSGVLIVGWVGSRAWIATRDNVARLVGLLVLGVTVVAVVSMSRFLFHAVYVHTHLVFAVAAVVAVGVGWLAVTRAVSPATALVGCTLGTATLVLIRPDGSLFAALVVLPVVTASTMDIRYRAGLLGLFGLVTAAWNASVGYHAISVEGAVRLEPWALTALGVLCAAAAVVLWRVPKLQPPQGILVHGAHAVLWISLAAFTLRDPAMLMDTLRASWANVISVGFWGRSLFFLFPLAVLALSRIRETSDRVLWFPVVSFVPFWFLLPYLRDAPWRVSPADSGNRLIFHVVLLVALLVIAMVPRPRGSDLRGDDDADVVPSRSGVYGTPSRIPEDRHHLRGA
jgi:hypothetical protein